jgi:hypothetical protein
MSELTYYCWACYGRNAVPAGICLRCGGEIEAPPSTSYAERLLWALEHPVSERRVEAALILGQRRERSAARRLRALALESPDSFLAAAALESLVAICGVEPTRELLEPLANSRRAHLRAVARRLLEEEGQA